MPQESGRRDDGVIRYHEGTTYLAQTIFFPMVAAKGVVTDKFQATTSEGCTRLGRVVGNQEMVSIWGKRLGAV